MYSRFILFLSINITWNWNEGKHFETLVKQGQKIKKETPLVRFDKKAIEEKGYNLVTMMIITNGQEFNELKLDREPGFIRKGEKL